MKMRFKNISGIFYQSDKEVEVEITSANGEINTMKITPTETVIEIRINDRLVTGISVKPFIQSTIERKINA